MVFPADIVFVVVVDVFRLFFFRRCRHFPHWIFFSFIFSCSHFILALFIVCRIQSNNRRGTTCKTKTPELMHTSFGCIKSYFMPIAQYKNINVHRISWSNSTDWNDYCFHIFKCNITIMIIMIRTKQKNSIWIHFLSIRRNNSMNFHSQICSWKYVCHEEKLYRKSFRETIFLETTFFS